MKNLISGLVILLFASAVSGCATDISGNSYSDDSVGEASQTFAGVVMKVRSVKVALDQLGNSHVGMIEGGIAGALIGSQMGSGVVGALATVGLAGAGALGGAVAEKKLKTQEGLEITVRLKSGELRTVVQGNDVNFKRNESILLLIYQRGRCKVVKQDDEAKSTAEARV